MLIFRDSSTSKPSNMRNVVSRLSVNPFWHRILYFLSISLLGLVVLKALKPRTDSFKPRNLDLFFTSVSSITVSSMSTVEMEVFSDSQLIVITILMFLGGEVFTSMTALFTRNLKEKLRRFEAKVGNHSVNGSIESGVTVTNLNTETLREDDHSRKFLSFVVLGYLLAVNLIGAAVVSLYLSFASGADSILKSKGLKLFTFSVFTTVSSFTNCGFIPTNENMVVFRKHPGLLLIIIPQVLLGNALFPPFLRFSIWVLGKVLVKKVRKDSDYLLKNTGGIEYPHLLPSRHSWCLLVTVLGILVAQVVAFMVMEWNSDSLSGMNSFEKVVGALFQSVNARHAGETIVDISTISAAILVLATVCMYLPPYATFLFLKEKEEEKHLQKRSERSRTNGVSDIAYLSIFVILVCITERKNIKEDPLNFNVFNIVLEVVSAYGNVGFTMGYSCHRRLHVVGPCEDKWYGFVGRWSDAGKAILIAGMFFGRLKNFNLVWKRT